MYLPRGIVQFFILKLLLIQPIFSEIIRLKDGDIIYEYDNSGKPLGSGVCGVVYSGIRLDGNHTEAVVFKELSRASGMEEFLNEKDMYEMMGHHDSLPRFYHYFPKTNETGDIIVIERIGRDLKSLWDEFRPFSAKTIVKVGVQMLDVLEWMHSNGFTHNDVHMGNIAVGYQNDSKIHLFDFNFATKKQNKTSDLSDLANTLIATTRPNLLDRSDLVCFERNPVLKEFLQITKEYKNIHDESLRTQTFGKLRKLLKTELEKLTNGNNKEESDFSYLEGPAARMNQLRRCIKQNDTSGIKRLIQQGLDIKNAGFGDRSYFRPIHLAAVLGNAHVVRFLIDHGAEVNAIDQNNLEISPLHYAAAGDHFATPVGRPDEDVVRILIKHGAKINAKSYDGNTPLHVAAQCGNANICKILVEKGADTSVKDKFEITPIMYGNTHVKEILEAKEE